MSKQMVKRALEPRCPKKGETVLIGDEEFVVMFARYQKNGKRDWKLLSDGLILEVSSRWDRYARNIFSVDRKVLI